MGLPTDLRRGGAVHRLPADRAHRLAPARRRGDRPRRGGDRVIGTGAADVAGPGLGHRGLIAGCSRTTRWSLPTIAAVNGPAVGAGLNLALAADVRIAGPGAVFDPRFQKLGIHPGGGATWMLQRAIGPQAARAALLFGMKFDADASVRHGLALEVADDPVAAALALAAGPASAPREVVLATKASMRATDHPGVLDHEQHAKAVDIEIVPQAASIESPEFAARLAAAKQR
nr:enoyl-CoA hydratase-related protein [Mycolicibacterium mucogenicum]